MTTRTLNSAYDTRIERLFTGNDFELALSMDCEGTNYDRNLDGNVANLERFLTLATDNGITTILFVTPHFSDKLREHGLAQRLTKDYRVIYGLHIHPDNLPPAIASQCPFLRPGEEFLANYSRAEQELIITLAYAYLSRNGIAPLQIFRGGCFSMNTHTAELLLEHTPIQYESHNPFREQYDVRPGLLKPLPVYALSRDEELRLEFFTTPRLQEMLAGAITQRAKALAITHSYMLDPADFHYARDGIVDDIHQRLASLIQTLQAKKASL
jgi:hypothetical protein